MPYLRLCIQAWVNVTRGALLEYIRHPDAHINNWLPHLITSTIEPPHIVVRYLPAISFHLLMRYISIPASHHSALCIHVLILWMMALWTTRKYPALVLVSLLELGLVFLSSTSVPMVWTAILMTIPLIRHWLSTGKTILCCIPKIIRLCPCIVLGSFLFSLCVALVPYHRFFRFRNILGCLSLIDISIRFCKFVLDVPCVVPLVGYRSLNLVRQILLVLHGLQ